MLSRPTCDELVESCHRPCRWNLGACLWQADLVLVRLCSLLRLLVFHNPTSAKKRVAPSCSSRSLPGLLGQQNHRKGDAIHPGSIRSPIAKMPPIAFIGSGGCFLFFERPGYSFFKGNFRLINLEHLRRISDSIFDAAWLAWVFLDRGEVSLGEHNHLCELDE
jgi:hypothetical protein